ncbi:hypothetical protein M8756_01880 [Lutimaribacter sp. EGI FJ00015]|uniref:Uncharacterized protein n=1 Tax=Lutimaribacter degradans TaxID=2945989 RepID=A0ACC5ZS54_9RHOB|nr:hypothetical protein [Lutimaribacter sp. EGI FJ00013]MCM2561010.1 hypothetical protein [Lutimaribacter sp. EGI FJ00013]MCO0612043.1 hypothetical protein [Lutimaribacter sp. EGI FJ00015]MCO0634837.1 hypothetical protein [Lutimaribacter sp. EGI FJ00014]
MDIMTGLSAAAKALEIAKSLREFEGKLNDATFKHQIAELYTALADAKMALADARQELSDKDAEIARLKAVDASKMRTVSYNGYNFGIGADGKPIGRPFCPVCEKTKGIQVQITRGLSKHDLCPSCKAVYGTGGYPWKLPDDFEIPPA